MKLLKTFRKLLSHPQFQFFSCQKFIVLKYSPPKKYDRRRKIFSLSHFSEIKKRFPRLMKLVRRTYENHLVINNKFLSDSIRMELKLGQQSDLMSSTNQQQFNCQNGNHFTWQMPVAMNLFPNSWNNITFYMIPIIVNNFLKLITTMHCCLSQQPVINT